MIHLPTIFVVWKGKCGLICVLGDIFAQNDKNSFRNLINSPKITGYKTQAKCCQYIYTLNITIGYVRLTKIFHNITTTLCFKSVTSPVTSKITVKYVVSQKR